LFCSWLAVLGSTPMYGVYFTTLSYLNECYSSSLLVGLCAILCRHKVPVLSHVAVTAVCECTLQYITVSVSITAHEYHSINLDSVVIEGLSLEQIYHNFFPSVIE